MEAANIRTTAIYITFRISLKTIIHKYNLVTLSWNTPLKNIFEFQQFLNTAASVASQWAQLVEITLNQRYFQQLNNR